MHDPGPESPSGRTKASVEMSATASPTEVMTAIESLSDAALLRLRSYARYRMRALGARAMAATYEDLLSEAITSTLAGQRRWNRDSVDIIGHLCGVMRSVSSHWQEERGSIPGEDFLDFEHASPAPSADREASARQEVERIERFFAEDHLVLMIVEALKQGMKGPEIQGQLKISQTDYETAVKRLRRGVQRLERMGEDYV
jgi:RNA polymerase sigma-70 factor (ECF subfamily)